MTTASLICLGLISGAGAGLLAGLIGIGGGIVVVPVVYYGLVSSGVAPDEAVHVAVATSLAAILPEQSFHFSRTVGPAIPTSRSYAIGDRASQLASSPLSLLLRTYAAPL